MRFGAPDIAFWTGRRPGPDHAKQRCEWGKRRRKRFGRKHRCCHGIWRRRGPRRHGCDRWHLGKWGHHCSRWCDCGGRHPIRRQHAGRRLGVRGHGDRRPHDRRLGVRGHGDRRPHDRRLGRRRNDERRLDVRGHHGRERRHHVQGWQHAEWRHHRQRRNYHHGRNGERWLGHRRQHLHRQHSRSAAAHHRRKQRLHHPLLGLLQAILRLGCQRQQQTGTHLRQGWHLDGWQ